MSIPDLLPLLTQDNVLLLCISNRTNFTTSFYCQPSKSGLYTHREFPIPILTAQLRPLTGQSHSARDR